MRWPTRHYTEGERKNLIENDRQCVPGDLEALRQIHFQMFLIFARERLVSS